VTLDFNIFFVLNGKPYIFKEEKIKDEVAT